MRVLLDTMANGGSSAKALVVSLVVAVFYIATFWRIFSKAGQPGWASIIPIYNTFVLLT